MLLYSLTLLSSFNIITPCMYSKLNLSNYHVNFFYFLVADTVLKHKLHHKNRWFSTILRTGGIHLKQVCNYLWRWRAHLRNLKLQRLFCDQSFKWIFIYIYSFDNVLFLRSLQNLKIQCSFWRFVIQIQFFVNFFETGCEIEDVNCFLLYFEFNVNGCEFTLWKK